MEITEVVGEVAAAKSQASALSKNCSISCQTLYDVVEIVACMKWLFWL